MTRTRRLAVLAFSIIALIGAVLPAAACKNETTSADTQQQQQSDQSASQGVQQQDQGEDSSSQPADDEQAHAGAQPSDDHKSACGGCGQPPQQPENPCDQQQPAGSGGECEQKGNQP